MITNDTLVQVYNKTPMSKRMISITHDHSLTIRNKPLNAFLVFDDTEFNGYEFLRQSLMPNPYLGINRDKYSSFNSEYRYWDYLLDIYNQPQSN